jgi:hypothetical protein
MMLIDICHDYSESPVRSGICFFVDTVIAP